MSYTPTQTATHAASRGSTSKYLDTVLSGSTSKYLDTVLRGSSSKYLDTVPRGSTSKYLDTVPKGNAGSCTQNPGVAPVIPTLVSHHFCFQALTGQKLNCLATQHVLHHAV